MPTPNATDRLDLGPWQIGDLRLTAFPALTPIEAGTEGKRWEALVGRKPEPVIIPRSDNIEEESGPFPFGGKLSRLRSPRVVQWMLQGDPNPDRPGTFSLMSPQALMPFKDLMCGWLMDCPPLHRLGFGAALYLPVAGREEGYGRLRKYLPFRRVDSPESGDFLEYSPMTGDFLYQFNRRRESRPVPGVEINRLSKWTWVPLGDVRAAHGKLVFPPESACLLELDINTAPEFLGILPHDRYVPLFEEMAGLAVEIATKGDVS
jgi:hypothetical protein